MLVLTRRVGEGITIGTNIRVVVVEMKGGQVRLGIEAPTNVPIHRDEIYAKVREENKKAAATEDTPVEALKKLGSPAPDHHA
jgi:carbon storage regulator